MSLAQGFLKYVDAIRGAAVAADLASLGVMGIGAVGGAVASPVLIGGAVAIAGIAGIGILCDWHKAKQLDAIIKYFGRVVENQGDQTMMLEQVLELAIRSGNTQRLPSGVELAHVEKLRDFFLANAQSREEIINDSPQLRNNLLGVMAAQFDALKEQLDFTHNEIIELGNELRSNSRDLARLLRLNRNVPPLWVPDQPLTNATRFRFDARRVEMVGRAEEMEELQEFLAAEKDMFLWWIWTGEAGMGKSRLALQLCRGNWRTWNVGFLDWQTEQFRKWDVWEPDGPTLIIFDYVARHITAIRDAIEIMRTRRALEYPVRFLLLERPIPKVSDWERAQRRGDDVAQMQISSGSTWWDDLCPSNEDPIVDSQYTRTRTLSGLTHDAAKAVLTELARLEDVNADADTIDQWARKIREVDAKCRPLLVAMGFEAIRDAGGEVLNWSADQLVQHIVHREMEKQWKPPLKDAGADVGRFINLLMFAAMCPGLTIDSPAFEDVDLEDVLPRRLAYDDGRTYARLVPDATHEAIPSVQPDLIAECLLAASMGSCTERDTRLIGAAWRHHPTAFTEFLERLVQTFPDAGAVDCMLARNRNGRDGPAEGIGRIWIQRGYAYLYRKAVQEAITALTTATSGAFPAGIRAEALGIRGALKAMLNLPGGVDDLTAVIDMPDAPAEQKGAALSNRGVAKANRGDLEGAIADCTAVIDMPGAPAEQKAQALNNRAVTYRQRRAEGDVDLVIADCTAVIDMPDAPAEQKAQALNNRAVAYGRRGAEGDDEREIADCTAVIDMPDAPAEQKAKALNNRTVAYGQRGAEGDIDLMIADCTALIDTPVATAEQMAQALINRGVTYGRRGAEGDDDREIGDCTAVIDMPDATAEHKAIALHNRGMVHARRGAFGSAVSDLLGSSNDPHLPEEDRQHTAEVFRRIAGIERTCEPEVQELREMYLAQVTLPAEVRAAIQARFDECEEE